MNKFTGLTLVFVLGVILASHGQQEETTKYISKGQWLAGGRLSLSARDDFENFTFSVSPMGGYFFGNNIAAGLQANYSFNTLRMLDANGSQIGDGKRQTVGVSPFVRCYFSVNKVAPFAELMGGASWTRYEMNVPGVFESNDKSSSSFYSVGAGLNYFISRDVALEGVLRFTDDNGYNKAYLDFDLGLQFFLSRGNGAESNEEGNYFSKGQWLIGGTGNVALGAADDIDLSSFSISPLAGYLVGQKIAVGLSTTYAHAKGYFHNFSAAPFVRYYFTQKKWAPYAEASYGGSWTWNKYIDPLTNEEVVNKHTDTSYRVGAGLNYFISKNVALDGTLRYSRNNDADRGSIGFGIGLQFFLR